MIYTQTSKEIKIMFTPFRDGLQSSFGGKVRLKDILPAMEASVAAGFRHFEFGGGARYQAPYFYLDENPFEDMRKMKETVGPGVDLQILTRSVSGVTLTTQSMESLDMQAKLMQEYGTTYDRNFDYMNDVDNLIKTGKPIVDSGMHHQVCIAIMGLPFDSDKVHTAEFYINIGKRLLDSGIQIDSICLKDASGTTDPKTIYDTVLGLKKIMPPEMPLWQHTHDTASMAVACYMAGIQAGVDGVDVSIRPMASGTVQPDIRSLNHALKGTGYKLNVDVSKVHGIEDVLTDGLKEYNFNPTTTTADARVLGFPMPGGAIGPNVHMMVKAGILNKYSEVLAEFPVVVEAGGAWTSVTPGSQQYWLQAFNNVMYGRWEKIEAGYGRAVLGYFGKTPLPPAPEVVQAASKQLDLPVFEGDPLEAAPNNIEPARQALKERGLPVNDVNTFLVLAAMVPGKKMEVNEGIRFLTGKGKVDIPLKKKEEERPPEVKAAEVMSPHIGNGPITSKCTIEEKGKVRTFVVTLETVSGAKKNPQRLVEVETSAPASGDGKQVYSTFAGKVDIVDILVKVGDSVFKGQVVAQVEAMKAKHDIKSQVEGTVTAVHIEIGDEIDYSQPILTIA
jgi:pyruvate carboxylase subunit B